MPIWLNFVFGLLRAVASVTSLWNVFGKKEKISDSPFLTVPIDELAAKLPSPLHVRPNKVMRGYRLETNPGLQILLGGAGVGKTREAIDYVEMLARLTGATTVYLARGYVNAMAPLPSKSDIRRIIVLLDDYDYGFPSAAALSFDKRQAGYAEAMDNLSKLYRRIKSSIDLQALIVTVNTHRLPLSLPEIRELVPDSSCTLLPAVSPAEFREFINAAGQALGIQMSNEAVDFLTQNCDGRFDTVATFLATRTPASAIGKTEAEKYTEVRHAIWRLFRSNLSIEQQAVYDQVSLLKRFRLPPRLGYLTALVNSNGQNKSLSEVQNITASIWSVSGEKAVVYDGQFEPHIDVADVAGRSQLVANAILSMRNLRFRDRYAYQEEAKIFGLLWVQVLRQKEQSSFFRRLTKWYPHDRYFAYLLADSYAASERFYRAIFALYRVLRRPDIRSFYSGKWVEIQCHLLLAQLYMVIGKGRTHDWDFHRRVEREFELAANLADLDVPDVGPDGFKIVYTSRPSVDWKRRLEIEHKELGFDVPSSLSLNSKRLRAMVHHHYSSHLLSQTHREFDALEHENLVVELLPGFGEAVINCAQACIQIGDSKRALDYIERAKRMSPTYLDLSRFEFMLSQCRAQALEGIGDLDGAREELRRCIILARKSNFSQDAALSATFESILQNTERWEFLSLIVALRVKSFEPNLCYQIQNPQLTINFPQNWKIDREVAIGDKDKFLIQAIFSSQIKWDSLSKSPLDASIDITCTNHDDEMCLNPESLGARHFEKMNKLASGCIQWYLDEEMTKPRKDLLCVWRFKAPRTTIKIHD